MRPAVELPGRAPPPGRTASPWSASATSAAPRPPTSCSTRWLADAGLADRVARRQLRPGRLARRRPDGPPVGRARSPPPATTRPGTAPGSSTPDWPARYDLVLAMDRGHLRGPAGQARLTDAVEPARVRLFRDFDPGRTRRARCRTRTTVAHDGFEEVLTMVERTSDAIVAALRSGSASPTMTRQPGVARRAEALLGSSVVATAPVAGRRHRHRHQAAALRRHHGPDEDATRTRPRASSPPRRAGCAGWPRPPGRRRPRRARRRRGVRDPALDRAGQAHPRRRRRLRPGAGAPPTRPAPPSYGARARTASSAGSRCPTRTAPTWAEFYATRRVLPYLRLGRDRGRGQRRAGRDRRGGRSAGSPTLVPEEPPARLHGDLWNGNVLWGTDGRVWVIDPAAHGGHRETDLAMLALFGLPHLARVLDAYDEAAPLADGWQDRVGAAPAVPAARARRACSAAGTAPAPPTPPPASSEPRTRPPGFSGAAQARLAQWTAVNAASRRTPPPHGARRRRRPGRARVAAPVPGVQRLRRRRWPPTAPRRWPASAGSRPRRGGHGRDDAAARRARGHPRAAHGRQRRADPGAHRPRRRGRPGRGARRRRRRLPDQAVRPGRAAGPAARAAAPRRPRRRRRRRGARLRRPVDGPGHPRGAARRPRRSS